MNRLRASLLTLATSSLTAFAADQRIIVSATPKQFAIPDCVQPDKTTSPCISTAAVINAADAATVLLALGAKLEVDRYYLIHSLKYEAGEKAPVVKDATHWYVYCHKCVRPWYESGPSIDALFKGKRIFGTPNVSFVYIHQGVKGATRKSVTSDIDTVVGNKRDSDLKLAQKQADDAAKAAESPDAVARKKNADENLARAKTAKANQSTAVQDAVDKLGKGHLLPDNLTVRSDNGDRLLPITAGYFVEARFLPVRYEIEVTKKLPSNLQNLRDVAGMLLESDANTAVIKTEEITVGLVQETPIEHIPSDVSIVGFVGQESPKELARNTFDDEGRHWWDISFLVPLNSYKEVQYEQTAGVLTPKTVTKQNVFAAFNLYLPPANTKGTVFRWLPHLIYGLPIRGQILNHHLLAVGVGLNKVEFYAGVTFNREQLSAAELSKDRWVRKLSIGINIPVRSALDAFKGGKAKD